MQMRKNLYKVLLIVGGIAVFIFLAHMFRLREYLSVEGFNNYHDQIVAYADAHTRLFIFGYIVLYILIIACCIPGTILFDLLAGFMFGIWGGSALVIFSYLTGACVNFIIVRFFFRGMLEHKFGKFKHFIHGSGKYGLLINLISLRLIAVIPFWILNIVAALLNVRMGTFILSTLIGITPMSVIYVVIGDGVRDTTSNGQKLTPDVLTNPKIWIPLFCMAAILMAPNIIKLIKNKTKSTQ
jgi:uncharacterized membrane protein YdjX (TVP38/TMEM64 family)